MRELARFDAESRAEVLADALFVEGIGTTINQGRDGEFVVWVHDESRLEEAKEVLESYAADPTAEHFTVLSRRAGELRKAQKSDRTKGRFRTVRVRERWATSFGTGRFTLGLIIVSILVSLLTRFGQEHEIMRYLSIVDYERMGPYIRWDPFQSFAQGQVWRVITPIFVHLGFLHLLFNMWWLKDLGSVIEARQGPWFIAMLVLAVGAVSNLAQLWIGGNPMFGGMSGVIYGLFGYIWTRGRFDPMSGYALPPNIVFWMVGWFVICLTGLVGPVANITHGAGLVLGGVWGWLLARLSRRR